MHEQISLFLKIYRNGSHLIVSAPGSFSPFSSKQMNVDFPQTLPPPPHTPVSEEQKKDFMISLADSQSMRYDYFSETQIIQAARGVVPEGFRVTRFVPLSYGGDNKAGNCVLIENSAYPAFRTIWRKIIRKVTAHRDTGSQIRISLPEPPPVITSDHVDRWLQSNQQAFEKEQNHQKAQDKITTRIHQESQSDGSVLLWFSHHSFVNQPTVTVTLSASLPHGRDLFSRDTDLHKNIYRRDATLLKNLGSDEVYRMKKRCQLPKDHPLQIHHVHPLSWGGLNTLGNICFVRPEDHARFNDEIEMPLNVLLSNQDFNRTTVRVCLPVPLQAYRCFPKLTGLNVTPEKAPAPSSKKITPAQRKGENRKNRRCDKQSLAKQYV